MAIASPIPRLAPVIRATLFSREKEIIAELLHNFKRFIKQ
jgi:hypothetical protein